VTARFKMLLTVEVNTSIFSRKAELWCHVRHRLHERPPTNNVTENFLMNQNVPTARKDSLIVKELPDETLVYDTQRDKAHCLNSTAALVWKNCDGKRTVGQLRELMEQEAGAPVPEEMVWLALDQLETFKLLDDAPAKPSLLSGMSRRNLVKRIGFAAIAIPVIISISAPPASAQGSPLPPGSCCGNPNQCQSNNCAQGPCGGVPNPSTKVCL
jgi:hypothetical protein